MEKIRKTLLLLLGILLWNSLQAQILDEETVKLARSMALIERFYVDSVDQHELVEQAIVAMLHHMDPHSVYIPAEEVKEMNEPLEGNYDGIGVQFNILEDTILVISPIPGGPSEKVGIRPGDRIVSIEGENVSGIGISTNGVRKRLLGQKGTRVNIQIFRRGNKGLLDFEITRDAIPMHSLDAAHMLTDEIGYVKLNRFSLTTYDEFTENIKRLKGENLEHLIIDLRNNTGGYMDPAIQLADQFLTDEELIVYIEGKSTPRRDYQATAEALLPDARVVVLLDEGSASASEILAGALQDWDRGIIIGRRSFGKGLVQNGFYMSDGSMIRLTIARYYTPTGRSIQKPYDQGFEKYIMDLMNRYEAGEYVSADSIEFPDSLKYRTLRTERTVYGGGGIMPDLFVPLDTTGYSPWYGQLIRKNVITDFILSYVDQNRKKLERKYADFPSFAKEFRFTDAEIKAVTDQAVEAGVPFNEEQFKESEEQLRRQLRALVARDLWDMNEYYEVFNTEDKVIQEAVRILSDQREYNQYLGK